MSTPLEPAPGVASDVSRRPGLFRRAANLWRYRELLVNLVRKELKVKYKNSALGFAWSLLNPALYLVVFYVVFQLILGAGLPYFAIFFLAGLLPWNLFSTGLAAGTTSMVANAALVGKVWFPREILPLAAIGAAIVHFLLQLLVLAVALVIFRYTPSAEYSLLVVPAFVALMLFLGALAITLSAVNVYVRDTQHLLELALLAWFWFTPIVYPYGTVADKLGANSWLLLLNPLTPIVITFQRAIYNRTATGGPPASGGGVAAAIGGGNVIVPDESGWWYLRNLGLVAGGSLVLLFGAVWLFGRLEDDLAEEL